MKRKVVQSYIHRLFPSRISYTNDNDVKIIVRKTLHTESKEYYELFGKFLGQTFYNNKTYCINIS